MRKKILLSIGAVIIVLAGVAAMSAYEAHVINVTAHIENALKVLPVTKELEFGTVFPQEYRAKVITITTSQSFCESDQTRVLNIDYKIVQKPKPIWEQTEACKTSSQQTFANIDEARAYCHDNPDDLDCCYPSLCPYLSKTPADKPADLAPYDDQGVLAFHDPSSIAIGTINKINDLQDDWLIDLPVPCFEGMCDQGWADFVYGYNPNAVADQYILPAGLESSDFGCDLWIEVTDIY